MYGRACGSYDLTLFLIRENEKRIRIIGDYDIDGVCSSFILIKGLEKAGAAVDHRLPHRIKDGYGLNTNIINENKMSGETDFISPDIVLYEFFNPTFII